MSPLSQAQRWLGLCLFSMFNLRTLVFSCMVVGFSMPGISYGQSEGCTDPQALNYLSDASINDGSCVYPSTNVLPTAIANLNVKISETSGLVFHDGLAWMINDSGNAPVLYGLDTLNGVILHEVVLANAPNIDWESIAQSEDHLFIGDFGNNNGNRTNLQVLIVHIDSLSKADTVWAEILEFNYEEQKGFTPASNANEYDAEAFYYAGDSLHLFTKNWLSQTTRYYTLPATAGTYSARLKDSFDCDGLITGATIDPVLGVVVLCGYKPIGFGLYNSFLWLLWDYPPSHPFRGNKRRIGCGTPLNTGQLEAVWMDTIGKTWLTGEAISLGGFSQPAKLTFVDLGPFYLEGTSAYNQSLSNSAGWSIYPNPANGFVTLAADPSLVGLSWSCGTPSGQIVLSGHIAGVNNTIYTAHLPSGIYYFTIPERAIHALKLVIP